MESAPIPDLLDTAAGADTAGRGDTAVGGDTAGGADTTNRNTASRNTASGTNTASRNTASRNTASRNTASGTNTASRNTASRNTASGTDTANRNTAGGGIVHVELVDVAGLCDEGLSLRLKVLGRAESQLVAMKAQVLAEVSRRHSASEAQRVVRDELQASKREAKRDVESAARLAKLPATSEALASGEIPPGHARLIARASGEGDVDEALLVKAANTEPFDEFARTVKRHQQDLADDDGQALLDRQRKNRKARIFESPDSGMFVLSGEFDQITGARIATALTAKERKLWHREDPKARRTPQQRMADALAELICEPAGDGKSAGTDLLVIADFDVIKQQLDNPRLADGSAIPIVELHRLALEANLLPSIFDTKAQQMWLGRRLRTASEAQRVALIARDQHCIGCKANPLWCRAHHIIWWSKDGPTDVDNLVLVCDDCHHKIHDHGWQVYQHPETGKYHLKPPNPTNPTPSQKRHPIQIDHPSTKPDRSSRTDQPAQAGPTTRTERPGPRNTAQAGPTTRTERPSASRTEQTRPTNRTERRRPTQPGATDRTNRASRTDKPDRATQTDPTRSNGPNKPGKPDRQTGPNDPAQAGPTNRTDKPGKPDRQTEPNDPAQAGPTNRTDKRSASRTDKPDRTTQRKPDRTDRTDPDRTERRRPTQTSASRTE